MKPKVKIRLTMTVVGGRTARTYYVHDDKRPGGYDRMVRDAFDQAQKDTAFPRGCTISIRSNWQRKAE